MKNAPAPATTDLKSVYMFNGNVALVPKRETDKARLFEFPVGKSYPGSGTMSHKNVWVAKSLMCEYDRRENTDAGEVIIFIELPRWFERQNNL